MNWKSDETLFDVVFLVNAMSMGWILDRICKEIASHPELHCKIVYIPRNGLVRQPIPAANAYFFSHFEIAMNMSDHPRLSRGRQFVYFTHPDPSRNPDLPRLVQALNGCEKTYAMNGRDADWLMALGVDEARVGKMIGGVDPNQFPLVHKELGDRPVAGIVSAFYQRKSPDLMLDLIQKSPDWDFRLVAPGDAHTVNKGLLWSKWDRFEELMAMPNFELVERDYSDYVEEFSKFDLYLSLSRMEGGPIPLLECMAMGIPAVVTDTGFAKDVIRPELNGCIVPKEPSTTDLREAMSEAISLKRDLISESMKKFSWEGVAETFYRDYFTPLDAFSNVIFNKGLGAEEYLGPGWSHVETLGVWSVQKNAYLNLPLSVDTAGRVIRFRFLPIAPDSKQRQISVRLLSGGVARTQAADTNTVCELDLELDPRSVSLGLNTVEIGVSELFQASEVNPKDGRTLGVKLLSFSIEKGEPKRANTLWSRVWK